MASSIMAVLVVAGIRSAGAAGVVVFAASQRSTGMSLALSLLAEIERHPYEDPQGGATIGINGGENAGDKTTFDDIDDFHGWSESPPQSSGGVPMIEHTGWTRSVSVHFVDPANPTQTVASSRGLKRITVTVARGGKSVAMAWSLRSAAP